MSKAIAYQWGFTEVNMAKSNYMWKIKNFNYLNKNTSEKIDSTVFSIEPNAEMKWFLRLYPMGIDDYYKDYLSIYFYSKSSIDFEVDVQCTISVLNSKSERFYTKTKIIKLSKNCNFGFPEYIERNFLMHEPNDMLINDVITIFCEYIIIQGTVNSSMKGLQHPQLLERKALNAFEQQLESDEFYDFTITAPCGKQLHAHKFVLAARSPVFSAMINRDMKEKTNNAADIENIDYASLKEVLRFMYAAEVENLDKLAAGVLTAAEMYEIDGLKDVCEEYLFKNLSIETAVETLTLSYRFKFENLKAQTSKFITCHAKDIISTLGFQSIDETDLLAEIVRIMASSNSL